MLGFMLTLPFCSRCEPHLKCCKVAGGDGSVSAAAVVVFPLVNTLGVTLCVCVCMCVCVCVCVFVCVCVCMCVYLSIYIYLPTHTHKLSIDKSSPQGEDCENCRHDYHTPSFRGFISISGGWILLCKQLIVAKDSPCITMPWCQCSVTHPKPRQN